MGTVQSTCSASRQIYLSQVLLPKGESPVLCRTAVIYDQQLRRPVIGIVDVRLTTGSFGPVDCVTN